MAEADDAYGFTKVRMLVAPVLFFSSIALVLGTQMLLAGSAIANRSSVAAGSLRVRFALSAKRSSFMPARPRGSVPVWRD